MELRFIKQFLNDQLSLYFMNVDELRIILFIYLKKTVNIASSAFYLHSNKTPPCSLYEIMWSWDCGFFTYQFKECRSSPYLFEKGISELRTIFVCFSLPKVTACCVPLPPVKLPVFPLILILFFKYCS